MTDEYGAHIKYSKIEELGEKPVLVPIRPPNAHTDWPRIEPSLVASSDRLATNCLSHSMA